MNRNAVRVQEGAGVDYSAFIRTDVLEGEMAAGTIRAGGYGSVAEGRDPLHFKVFFNERETFF